MMNRIYRTPWVALILLGWLLAACAGRATGPTPATAAPVVELPPPTVAAMTPTDRPSATPQPTATVVPVVGVTLQPTPTLAGDATATPPPPTATPSPATAALPSPAPGQGPRPTLPALVADPTGPAIHGNRDAPLIALTFDACQRPDLPAGFDEALIQVLIDTGTPATLFLGGDWMRTHPEATRLLAAQPQFELGSHGYAHIDFATATVAEMAPELEQTQQIMWELIGRQPHLFRFPGGTYTPEALTIVAGMGLRPIEWEVVSGDPDPDITAERMIPWVVNQVQNGSIIIMHMNGRGWHTAEALPTIIEQLRAEGFQFVTVSQLLGEAPLPPTPAAVP